MRLLHLTTLSTATALLLLSGCGSSSDSSSSMTMSNDTVTYEGVVADGYLQGATVCADLNSNGACDESEPSVTTDENGHYVLTLPNRQSSAEIIASIDENTIDSDDGKAVGTRYVLRTLKGKEHLFTPLTNLVQQRLQSDETLNEDEAIEEIKSELGLDDSVDLFTDYIKTPTQAYKKAHQKARLIAKVEKALNTQLKTLGMDEPEDGGTSWIKQDIIAEHLSEIGATNDESDLEAVAQAIVKDAITIKNFGEIRKKIAHYRALHKLKRLHHIAKRIETNISSDAIVSELQNGGLYTLHRDYAPSYDENYLLRITTFMDEDADLTIDASSSWFDSTLSAIEEYKDSNRSFYLLQDGGWALQHRDLTHFTLQYEHSASLTLSNEANESFLAEPLAAMNLEGRYFGGLLTRYSHEPHYGRFSEGAIAYKMRYTSLQDRYIVRPFILQCDTRIEQMFTLRGSAVDSTANVIVPDANSTKTFASLGDFTSYFAYDEGNLSQPFAPAPMNGGIAFASNNVAYFKAPYSNVLVVGSYEQKNINDQEVIILSFEMPFAQDDAKRQLLYSVVDGHVKVGAFVPAGKRYNKAFTLFNSPAHDDLYAALQEESTL